MPGERGPIGRGLGHRKGRGRHDHGDHPAGASIVPFRGRPVVPPPMPTRLLKRTQLAWHAYWESELARLINPADHAAVERLFGYVDEQLRLWRTYKAERFVEGTRGQWALSPALRGVALLEPLIERLEKRLGITPGFRARLGLHVTALHRSIEEIAAAADIPDEDEDDEDPRVVLLEQRELDSPDDKEDA